MDIVAKEDIKVPNSLIVSELVNESDEELVEFLNKYGCIARVVSVDSPHSPYHKNAIVEYESGAAINALKPMLPYNYESPSHISYQLRALSSEYVPIASGSATKNFLSELQRIAKLSGRSFEEILQKQLSECTKPATVESESVREPAASVIKASQPSQ